MGDAQWLMYPVGDGGGEEDLCHVRSGGRSVADDPVGDGEEEEDLCHVRSGGCSVTHVPSGGWERKGGSLPCTQWGTLSDTCTQWGMGDTQWLMYPVGDGGGEEDLCHVRSGGHSVADVPMYEERRISAMYTVGDSVTHVPSGWERKGGSLPWGMLIG